MHFNVGRCKWKTSHPPFHPLERCAGRLCIERLLVLDIFSYFRTRGKKPARPARCLACTQFHLLLAEEQKQFLCVYVTYPLNLSSRRSGAEYRSWHSYAGLCNGIFSPSKKFFPPARTSRFSLPSIYFNTNTTCHAVKSAPSVRPTTSQVCTT